MATLKQLSIIERTLVELGREFVQARYENMPIGEASKIISELFEERNKAFKDKATPHQMEMFKDMIKCPMISRHFEEELAGVPQSWLELKKDLMDDAVILSKEIDKRIKLASNPYKSERIGEVTGDENECILDYLVENDIIDMADYSKALWMNEEEQDAYVIELADKHNVSIREDERRKYLYRKMLIDVKEINFEIKKLQMNQHKLNARIAKANEKMQDMADNYDINKLTKTDIGNFIEKHREEFVQWKSTRLTEGQVRFIKELQERMCRQIHSSNMINEEGVEIKGGRYMYFHESALMSDDQIRLMSKDFASEWIKKAEAELYDTELIKFEVEAPAPMTIIEEKRKALHDEEDSKVASDLDTMIGTLYHMVNMDYEYGTGETIHLTPMFKVDLINMVVDELGKTRAVKAQLSEICSKYITSKEMDAIWTLI